ncbi:MAG: nucleotidyltransferase family protein [Bacteroidota bacterium]|jgi:predicted nucleotidyltransferase|uniref:nucleotidyltransferase family protein n=1 Tax=Candidatus Pollutiaquabacter sp. TaxID=3416354 RepID=UPI003BF6A08A|nr:nucleotidyltransferase family protein [Bacteroidota bacterium]
MYSAVSTKAEIITRLINNQDRIKQYGVRQLGLFGSFIRNEAAPDSDIDLLIDFYPDQKTFDNFIELAFFLEDLLGRKVELVTPASLGKYIGPHILREVEYVPFAA